MQKERRKAEKERIRLQQEQAQGSGSSVSTPAAASTPRAAGTPGSSASHVRNVTATTPVPKAKLPISARAGSARPNTPKSAAGAPQRTASTPASGQQPSGAGTTSRVTSNPVVVSARRPQGAAVNVVEKRGQKRELDAQPLTPGAPPSANTNGPRPQKKRRIVRALLTPHNFV